MMANSNSRQIDSSQTEPHAGLEKLVAKHLSTDFARPFAAHSVESFERAKVWFEEQDRPLIMDSFCGTGESTCHLAEAFPNHAVIGVDKSEARLQKGAVPDNALLLRADCDDFWRQAQRAGWTLERHYLLYPNPWPKPGQIKRRVHGSPLFAALLALGGRVELRSNWPVYTQEFAQALIYAGYEAVNEAFTPDVPMTAFERKYQNSGHRLYRVASAIISP